MTDVSTALDKGDGLLETALLFLQLCPHCGFCFLVEVSMAEYFSCPCCIHMVPYAEDWPYHLVL